MTRAKVGPGREYEPGELQLFARHRDDRAKVRPRACNGRRPCWVEQGPPALRRNGWCIGCDGLPGGGNPRGGRPRAYPR